MSAEPPTSGRPTGPPSGPLSGPSQPDQGGRSGPTPPPGTPSGPPYGPPDGGGTGDGGAGGPGGAGPGGPDRPWWRSVPRVAAIATAVVAAVVVTIVLTRPDDSGGGSQAAGGELFLETAGSSGPDPYTESTARNTSAATASPTAPPSVSPTRTNVTPVVNGSGRGLYGGTRKVASCNVEKQISALTSQQDKNKAFASVLDIEPTGVPAYLRSLTPVQLRMDTRVTNHGYRAGAPTPYQAVLQAGTAVLVDDRGVPRVRCACGNPLRPPVALKGTVKRTGDPWPEYRPANVVMVKPAAKPVEEFVMYDPESGDWFTRDKGDTGVDDEQTAPPAPDTTPLSPSPDDSPPTPSSESPSTESPATDPPSPQLPPSEPEPDSPDPDSPDPESPAPESPAPKSPLTALPPAPDSPAPDSPAPEGPTG